MHNFLFIDAECQLQKTGTKIRHLYNAFDFEQRRIHSQKIHEIAWMRNIAEEPMCVNLFSRRLEQGNDFQTRVTGGKLVARFGLQSTDEKQNTFIYLTLKSHCELKLAVYVKLVFFVREQRSNAIGRNSDSLNKYRISHNCGIDWFRLFLRTP